MIKVALHGKTRWLLAPPRIMSAGLDWKGRGPDVALRTLADNLKKRGGTLMLGTRASGAAHERQALRRASRRGAARRRSRWMRAACCSRTAASRAIPIWCGASSRRGRRASPSATPRTGQGDALIMAEAAGARLTDAGAFYGHLLSRDSMHNPGLWPYPDHGHARRRRHHGRPRGPPLHRRRARRHRAFQCARAPARSALRDRGVRPGDLGHRRQGRDGRRPIRCWSRPAAR